MDNGHIKGITRFKLYLPGTRGNETDEILQTEILRNLDYLAPRTIKVLAIRSVDIFANILNLSFLERLIKDELWKNIDLLE